MLIETRTKLFILFILLILLIIIIFSQGKTYGLDEIEYGITFSKKKAEQLGLDWRKAFLDILDELDVKKIRLPVYWDDAEQEDGSFFWDDLDWQIKEAEQRDVNIILAVGGRLPRWPECHFPEWAENLSQEKREEKIFDYIKNTINHFKKYDWIIAWQVENEPFLRYFGECPEFSEDFLASEIALVKSLDSRPVIITDSGELSLWFKAAGSGDIFGTTMYRDTYSKALKRYIHYPISPGFFRFKKNVVGLFAKPEKWIVIELQAEPWGPYSYEELSAEERARTMDLQKFKEILEFSRKTSFKEFYLWGVEWWYWEKEVNNNDEMWEEAKLVFKVG